MTCEPKDAADYKLIGREGRLRVDAVPKILGHTHFTIDVSLPGMLTAVVLHPPRFGATAASVDDQAALAEPGVTAVVPIEEGVAVVAETVADAQRGLRALVVEWDDTTAERRSTAELLAEHLRLLESGENAVTARDDGDVDRGAWPSAASTVDATYALPYLAHAPMEPNNAACRMREDGVLEVWVGTEAPEYVKMNASSIAGIDKEQVEVHVTFAGGSFGLHSSAERDPTAEAVQIARALDWKHPIKVQSLARGGVQGRPLPRDGRPPGASRCRRRRPSDRVASADRGRADVGEPAVRPRRDVHQRRRLLHDDRRSRPAVRGRELPARVDQLRVADPDDGVALGRQLPHGVRARVGDRRARDRRRAGPCRPATRAPRRQPADAARARARRRARGLGIAAARRQRPRDHELGFLGHSAQVTEVSLDDRGRVHVDRIVFALDCGRSVNPDLIRAQIEGGLLWGLSAASWGEVVLGEGGEIVTQNFDRLPGDADALGSADRGPPDRVGRATERSRRGQRPLGRSSAGERDRGAYRHSDPRAPHLQDDQDRLAKGHRTCPTSTSPRAKTARTSSPGP